MKSITAAFKRTVSILLVVAMLAADDSATVLARELAPATEQATEQPGTTTEELALSAGETGVAPEALGNEAVATEQPGTPDEVTEDVSGDDESGETTDESGDDESGETTDETGDDKSGDETDEPGTVSGADLAPNDGETMTIDQMPVVGYMSPNNSQATSIKFSYPTSLKSNGIIELVDATGTTVYAKPTTSYSSWSRNNSTEYYCYASLSPMRDLPVGKYKAIYVCGYDITELNQCVEVTTMPFVTYMSATLCSAATGSTMSISVMNYDDNPDNYDLVFVNRVNGDTYAHTKVLNDISITPERGVTTLNYSITFDRTLTAGDYFDYTATYTGEGSWTNISNSTGNYTYVYTPSSSSDAEIASVLPAGTLEDGKTGETEGVLSVELQNLTVGKEYELYAKCEHSAHGEYPTIGSYTFTATDINQTVNLPVKTNDVSIPFDSYTSDIEVTIKDTSSWYSSDDTFTFRADNYYYISSSGNGGSLVKKNSTTYHVTFSCTNTNQKIYAEENISTLGVRVYSHSDGTSKVLTTANIISGTFKKQKQKTNDGTRYTFEYDVKLDSKYINNDYYYEAVYADNYCGSISEIISSEVEPEVQDIYPMSHFQEQDYSTGKTSFWTNFGEVSLNYSIKNGTEDAVSKAQLVNKSGQVIATSYYDHFLEDYSSDADYYEAKMKVDPSKLVDGEKYYLRVLYNNKTLKYMNYDKTEENGYYADTKKYIDSDSVYVSSPVLICGDSTARFNLSIDESDALRNVTIQDFCTPGNVVDMTLYQIVGEQEYTYDTVTVENQHDSLETYYLIPQYKDNSGNSKTITIGQYRYRSKLSSDYYTNCYASGYSDNYNFYYLEQDKTGKRYVRCYNANKNDTVEAQVIDKQTGARIGNKVTLTYTDHSRYDFPASYVCTDNYYMIYVNGKPVEVVAYKVVTESEDEPIEEKAPVSIKARPKNKSSDVYYLTDTDELRLDYNAQEYYKVKYAFTPEGLQSAKYRFFTEYSVANITLPKKDEDVYVYFQFLNDEGQDSEIYIKRFCCTSVAPEIISFTTSPDSSAAIDGQNLTFTMITNTRLVRAACSFACPDELPEGSTKSLYFTPNGYAYYLQYVGETEDGNYKFELTVPINSDYSPFTDYEFDHIEGWLTVLGDDTLFGYSDYEWTEHISYPFVCVDMSNVVIDQLKGYTTNFLQNDITFSGYATANSTVTITLSNSKTGAETTITANAGSDSKYTADTASIPDGTYYITASDGTLTLDYNKYSSIVVDTVAPVIKKVTAVRTDANSDANVTISWECDDKDIAYYLLWKNNTPIITRNDSYTQKSKILNNYVDGDEYKIVAVDRVGHQSEPVIKVLGDEIPPSDVTGFVLVDRSSKTINLKWNAATDNVAVDGYKIWRDGVLIGTVDKDTLTFCDSPALLETNENYVALVTDTEYTYTIKAVDKAKNESENVATVTTSTVSPSLGGFTYSPKKEYIIEADQTYNLPATPTGNCTLNGMTLSFRYKKKGGEWKVVSEKSSLTYRTYNHEYLMYKYDPDDYVLGALLVDRDGTEAEMNYSTSVKHDYTKPVINTVTPAEDKLLNKTVSISVAVSDESRMGSVSIYAGADKNELTLLGTATDDVTVGENENGISDLEDEDRYLTKCEIDWDTSDIHTDYGYIKVVAKDYYGNEESLLRTIRLDNNAPAAPEALQIYADDTKISILWEKAEVEADFKWFRIYRCETIDGDFRQVGQTSSIGYYDDVTTGIVGEKDYYYYVTSVDEIGNESIPQTVLKGRMEVDTTAPVVNSYLPASNSKLCYSVTLKAAAYDNNKLAGLEMSYCAVPEGGLTGTETWQEIKTFTSTAKHEVFTYDWDLKSLGSNVDKIAGKYIATDAKGNKSEEVIVYYTIEPYSNPVQPEMSCRSEFGRNIITWTYSGNESLVDHYEVLVDDVSVCTTGKKEYVHTGVEFSSTHSYQIKVYDKYSASNESLKKIINNIAPDEENPVAVLKPNSIYIGLGNGVELDASESTDNGIINSYKWEVNGATFGTGAQKETFTPTEVGDYEIKLSVTDAFSNVGTATGMVHAVKIGEEDENGDSYRIVKLNTIASSDGAAVGNTAITIERVVGADEENTFEPIEGMTDTNGECVTILPTGSYKVTAVHDGYTIANSRILVLNKDDQSYNVVLRSMDMLVGKLTSREMSWDEIIAAGIDTDDPSNQHVFKFGLVFEFTSDKPAGGTSTRKLSYNFYRNQDGIFLGGNCPNGGTAYASGGFYFFDSGVKVSVIPASENLFLVIYGEAHWVKEMYDVELLLCNFSAVEHFEEVEATLNLPEGLSLAKMKVGAQSETISLGTIVAGATKNAHWYVRGDEEGEYDLSATVTGLFMPNNEEFIKTFKTTEPLKVWAGSALRLEVFADDVARKGEPYTVDMVLSNVSTKSLYKVGLKVTGSEQYTMKDDKKVLLEQDEQGSTEVSIDELKPGDSLSYTYTVTITDSDILQHTEYYLRNCFGMTLEGSTTEIPIVFNIKKDGVLSIQESKKANVIFRVLNEDTLEPVKGAYVFSDYIIGAGNHEVTDENGCVRFENVGYTSEVEYVAVAFDEQSIPVRYDRYVVASDLVEKTIYVPSSDNPYVMGLTFTNAPTSSHPNGQVRNYTYFSTAKYSVVKDATGVHKVDLDVNWMGKNPGKVYLYGANSKKTLDLETYGNGALEKYQKEGVTPTVYSYIAECAFGTKFMVAEKIDLVLETAEGEKFISEFPLRIVADKTTIVNEMLDKLNVPDFLQTAATDLTYLGGDLLGSESLSFGMSWGPLKNYSPTITYTEESIDVEIDLNPYKQKGSTITSSQVMRMSMVGRGSFSVKPKLKLSAAYDEFGYSKSSVTISVSVSSGKTQSSNLKYEQAFAEYYGNDNNTEKDVAGLVYNKVFDHAVYVYEVPGLFVQSSLFAAGTASLSASWKRTDQEDLKWKIKFVPGLKLEVKGAYGGAHTLSADLIKASLAGALTIQTPAEHPIVATISGSISSGVTVFDNSVEFTWPGATFSWSYPDDNRVAAKASESKLNAVEEGVNWYNTEDGKGEKAETAGIGVPVPETATFAADMPESKTLIENIYGGSVAQIVRADDDNVIMLLNRQQSDRTPANKMALMYSKAVAGEWTEPVLIDASNTALNGSFDAVRDNYGVWVVYQQMDEIFEAGYGEDALDVADYYSHNGIALNHYDPSTDTWSETMYISSPGKSCYFPTISTDGFSKLVAWCQTDAYKYYNGDFSSMEICYMLYDGDSWSEVQTIDLGEDGAMVTAIDANVQAAPMEIIVSEFSAENGAVQKSFTLGGICLENSADNEEDIDNIRAGASFTVNGITKKAYIENNAIVVKDSYGVKKIETYGTVSGLRAAVTGEDYFNAQEAVLYWTEVVGTGDASKSFLCISRLDITTGEWSAYSTVLTEEGNISGASAVLLDDENIAVTYMRTRNGKTDLCYAVTNFVFSRLAIDEEAAGFSEMTNGSIKLDIPLTNIGTKSTTGATIEVFSNDEEGASIGTATMGDTFGCEETVTGKVYVMPQPDTRVFHIVVTDGNGKVTKTDVDFNVVELGMDMAYFSSTPGTYDLDLELQNLGITSTRKVYLEVRKETIDGQVVAEREIGVMEALELQKLHIEIPRDTIIFTDDIDTYLVIAFEEGATDDEKFIKQVFLYKPEGVEIVPTYDGKKYELSSRIAKEEAFVYSVEAGKDGYCVDANGKAVLTDIKWTTQAKVDAFKAAIEKARAALSLEAQEGDDGTALDAKLDAAYIVLDKARNTFDTSFAKGLLIPATDITLNKTEVTLLPNKTLQLSVKLSSVNAKKITDAVVSYTSSDTSVATVSSKGKIKAIAEGDANIIVTLRSGLVATCLVHVRRATVSIQLSKTNVDLLVGKTASLSASFTPAGSTIPVTWASTDPDVITVTQKGVVTAVGAGSASISVTPSREEDLGVVETVYCEVTVHNSADTINLLSEEKITLGFGSEDYDTSSQIVIDVSGSDDMFTYSTDKPKIAKVDAEGKITAVAKGTAHIKVKNMKGKTKTITVTVKQFATKLTLNATNKDMLVGKKYTLKATTAPKSNNDKVVWSTSDESVATVSEKGIVTAVGTGTATITATAEYSRLTQNCEIVVSEQVTTVKITGSTHKLAKGAKITLKAAKYPIESTEKITWSSSDTTIATVTSKGEVKGIAPGIAIIRATAAGGAYAEYAITVLIGASSIALNKTSVTLKLNSSEIGADRFKLVATLGGTDNNDIVTFTSSNSKVAVVNSAGFIIAKGKGTATITAKTVSGKKKTCKVTVNALATGVQAAKKSIYLLKGKKYTLTGTAYAGSYTANTVSNKKVTWQLADPADAQYLTVASSGKITAKKVTREPIAVRGYAADGSGVYCTTYVYIR